jgi:adenylate cyclase
LRRLKEDGARAALFDVIFTDPSTPEEDEPFIAAMQDLGTVFLGGGIDQTSASGQFQEKILPPAVIFRKAAAGWGLLVFRPVDPDWAVREIYTGNEQKASATWVAAVKLSGKLEDTPEERLKQRWLNYYGPAGWIPNISYYTAVSAQDLPPGFFKDKIVLIGGRVAVAQRMSLGKDDFRTPFTMVRSGAGKDSRFAPGVEIHATALMNLLRGDWLERLTPRNEMLLLVGGGILFGILFSLLEPIPAVITGLISAATITTVAFWLQWDHHTWFNWLVPVGLQIPIGLSWSLGANYFVQSRRRKELRRAFAHYLSPEMADRISNSELDLRPGGRVMEVTMMFTDLEGFTTLSESLGDPEKLAGILTKYFTLTTEHVLQNKGLISKYIGDAVFAIWGAPEPDPDQCRNAVRAARGMASAVNIEVDGHRLRTRVGIHVGKALAGNLGSARRFDYTVIGDPVNFASRLEGLNKYLGTDILISDAIKQRIGDEFLTRKLGCFQVVGRRESCVIHELLHEDSNRRPDWLEDFESGLDAFTRGELDTAQVLFERVIKVRGQDGPSSLYLKEIEHCGGQCSQPWTGVVAFRSK